MNAERSDHFRKVAKMKRAVREISRSCAIDVLVDFGITVRPVFSWIDIEVRPFALDRRFDQDVGNCLPSVKSIMDGFVDAKIIFDDARRYVHSLKFYPHQFGYDAIEITMTGELFDSGKEVLPMKTTRMF